MNKQDTDNSPGSLRRNADGTVSVTTTDGHSARVDWLGFASLRMNHRVSDRWLVTQDPDGRLAVHAHAGDGDKEKPVRLIDLLAPSGPDYVYELADGNPLNIAADNMRRVWAWDVPGVPEGLSVT